MLKRRNKAAALKFLRKLLKRHGIYPEKSSLTVWRLPRRNFRIPRCLIVTGRADLVLSHGLVTPVQTTGI